jgi:hypothetical protein
MFGINLHSGGGADDTGKWSAGCQIIHSDPPWEGEWESFFEPIRKRCNETNQLRIPYLLVDVPTEPRWSNFGAGIRGEL